MKEIVSEKALEKKLISTVKKLGGTTMKLSNPNQRGVPDRLILFPNGKIGFLELKSKGKKPTKLQYHWLGRLRALGFIAKWTDNEHDMNNYLQMMVL